ncbi:MAG: type II toxin-antitoxin system VapC family toxin [Synechococcales cyanobacterium RU_4_20]|nr:type II toxin-antitoxin system VapC family toxin [Synechococcales cyanobacterium RU_4_20]NJR70722.1 type II toxin-antitoxin system VapC family toxin [Synechococcales cyanobacterium CRU_2_2]
MKDFEDGVQTACALESNLDAKPSSGVLDWLDAQPQVALYLNVITIGEIAKGISRLPESNRKRQLAGWLNQDLMARFERRIIGLDVATMQLWGDLVGQLETKGRVLPVMDSLIAAIAIQNSLTLATRNEADLVGTGVAIVNPW